MNTSETDITQTQPQPIDPLALLGIDAAIIGLILLATSIGSLLFFTLIIINTVRSWKVQNAILRLSKDVHEMNERQKPHTTTPSEQDSTHS